MTDFHTKIHEQVTDKALQAALDANAKRRVQGRIKAFASLPDWKERRQQAHAVRAEVIGNLNGYLDKFIAKLTENGITVHRAKDAAEARAIALEIIKNSPRKHAGNQNTSLVAKSKSMVSEEIELNHALEAAGHRVLTDATRSLKWKQEFLIVIGDSKSDGSKLALQLTPTPRRIEPIVDFPGQLLEWGARDPLYIVNRYDLRSRGAGAVAGGDPTASSDEIQALMIFDPKYGDFILSYQQFPGSVLAGYIENERIVFQWGDDLFELISSSAPVMPKGKWSLYVKRVDHKPNGPDAVGLGAMQGPPSKFESRD